MGHIYQIENKVNGKLYIGMTTKPIKRRWSKHKTAHKLKSSNMLLYSEMDIYGIDNFKIQSIESCLGKVELEERERFWIKEKNTLAPSGYNETVGGISLKGDENPFYGRKHSECTKARLSELAYKRDLNGKNNPFYGKSHSDDTKNKISIKNSKPVSAYTSDGVLVQSFGSGVLAGEWCREHKLTNSKSPNSDIFKSCKTGSKAFGYFWSYSSQHIITKHKGGIQFEKKRI